MHSLTTPYVESLDLHGTVVKEAVAISREFAAENWKGLFSFSRVQETCNSSSTVSGKPLRIITGRGKHSMNGISVLSPAVKNALIADGWRVDTFDGGVMVRGRAR